MPLTITFSKTAKNPADTAIVAVYKDNDLSPSAAALDRDCGGLISDYLAAQKAFKGKSGQTLALSPPKSSGYSRIVLLGLGNPQELKPDEADIAGGKLYNALNAAGATTAVFLSDERPLYSAHLAQGLLLRSYRFDKYRKSAETDDESATGPATIAFITEAAPAASKQFDLLKAAVDGVFFARDLVNEPPNHLYPESFAKRIRDELKPLGVEVEIFNEKKMEKLGFASHLMVGMGSARPPRVVVMRWQGSGAKAAKGGKSKNNKGPLAFVGKGVTFDTGGISIKPGANMDEMKMDMGGAAAVVGLMKTLALRKAKADVVGIVGLAENMPSHNAYRPGDIIDSMSGKTIEVMNTDAEGRLILNDSLTYVQKTYDPSIVVDLATLTGAVIVGLGFEYAGAFVNQDRLWQALEAASRDTGEKLWRMPLDEAYRKEMESQVADLKNLGNLGRYGGACSAAGFLEHFIDEGRAWAHIDIAGTAWAKADSALGPKYGTGFGVRVLDRMIADAYEG